MSFPMLVSFHVLKVLRAVLEHYIMRRRKEAQCYTCTVHVQCTGTTIYCMNVVGWKKITGVSKQNYCGNSMTVLYCTYECAVAIPLSITQQRNHYAVCHHVVSTIKYFISASYYFWASFKRYETYCNFIVISNYYTIKVYKIVLDKIMFSKKSSLIRQLN